jgi:hypothetical protein
MAQALWMADHPGLGKALGDLSHRAGVIEVDVAEYDPSQILGAKAVTREALKNPVQIVLGPCLDQGGLLGLDEEDRVHLGPTAQQRVDLPDPWGQ